MFGVYEDHIILQQSFSRRILHPNSSALRVFASSLTVKISLGLLSSSSLSVPSHYNPSSDFVVYARQIGWIRKTKLLVNVVLTNTITQIIVTISKLHFTDLPQFFPHIQLSFSTLIPQSLWGLQSCIDLISAADQLREQ